MLTCSVLPARNTLITAGQKKLLPLLYPSSKSNLLSLKQCVHKLMTQQQQCPLSSLSSSSVIISNSRSLQRQATTTTTTTSPSTSTWSQSQRIRHYYCCCLLNLNHHINFHYINNSSSLNICHHRFHQSALASAAAGADNVAPANGSITPNSLCHDIVNDSRKPELSSTDEWVGEKREELYDDDAVGGAEKDEILKEHVWDIGPTVLPTFNVAAYANESENVKKLVELVVDLSKWEGRYGVIPILYKSNFEKTMQPIITFLREAQVEGSDLSHVLTVNPYIFQEDVRNLRTRLEYLRAKRFSEDAILNIITRNPYWLGFSVPRIDRRLGFFQTYFGLTGGQVRKLANAGSSGPKLITFHLGRVKDVTFTIKEEMGFTSEEIVELLLAWPRLFCKAVPSAIRSSFDYLHNEEKFAHEEFLKHPMLLLTRERRLRDRIGFLRKLGRAQFDPEKPNYISPPMFCTGSDTDFASKVVGVSVEQYNNYLKTL